MGRKNGDMGESALDNSLNSGHCASFLPGSAARGGWSARYGPAPPVTMETSELDRRVTLMMNNFLHEQNRNDTSGAANGDPSRPH